jgi:hypothetical protein
MRCMSAIQPAAANPEAGEFERADERIDHANGIVLVDPIVEAFRQRRRLSPAPSTNRFMISPPQKSSGES